MNTYKNVVFDDYLYINIVNTYTTGCPLSKLLQPVKLRTSITSIYVNTYKKVVFDDYLYINTVNTYKTGCPLSKLSVALFVSSLSCHRV